MIVEGLEADLWFYRTSQQQATALAAKTTNVKSGAMPTAGPDALLAGIVGVVALYYI